ncbi:MAG: methyltransferase domain-containing protein [Nocardioides sp.]
MPHLLRVRRVDDSGLALVTLGDRPVDVCIDGRRVWTFWTQRDTATVGSPAGRGPWPVRHASWPQPLRRHLDGHARITVRDSATGEVSFDQDVALGGGQGPIRVQNQRGVELGIDKSGRLVPTFAGRSERDIAALLDATDAVIEALRSADVEPFIAYGTLLGAVREGAVLGHDSDADLGYVSGHSNPVDVSRESFEIQRRLSRAGWRITRYSGASFKIHVTEADVTRGLDVFGGFLDGGRLYLMGEIGTEFQRDWIYPLGTAQLDGRPMPVPARPEKLLEAMYGPSWRRPDPAFKFSTPARTTRAFDDWFRGTQPGSRVWEKRAYVMASKPLRQTPSMVGKRALALAEERGAEVLDIGAGRGSDSLWLARQGLSVTAYDFVPRALEPAKAVADREALDLEVRYLNLTEWRSVFAEGARLASRPRPRVITARNVVDATSGIGRESLARLCSMALREGGHLIAEFHVPTDDEDVDAEWTVGRPDLDRFTTLLRDAGATSIEVRKLRREGRPTVRLVGEW